jgi:hypothetical protein
MDDTLPNRQPQAAFPDPDHDPVSEQPTFVQNPALLRRARDGQKNREKPVRAFHRRTAFAYQ